MESIEVLKIDDGKLAIRVDGVRRDTDTTKGNRHKVAEDGSVTPRSDSNSVVWWTRRKFQNFLELARCYDGEYRTMLTVKFLKDAPMHPKKLKAGIDRLKRLLTEMCGDGGYVGGLEYGEAGQQVSPHYHILCDHRFTSKEEDRLRRSIHKRMIKRIHVSVIKKPVEMTNYVLKGDKGRYVMKPQDGSTAVGWEHVKLSPYFTNTALRDRQTKGDMIKIDVDVLELLGLDNYRNIYLKRIPLKPEHENTDHITMDCLAIDTIKGYYNCFKVAKGIVKRSLNSGFTGQIWQGENDTIRNIISILSNRLRCSGISVVESAHDHFERICYEQLKNIPLPDGNTSHLVSIADMEWFGVYS
jgi:hypothetical protein